MFNMFTNDNKMNN